MKNVVNKQFSLGSISFLCQLTCAKRFLILNANKSKCSEAKSCTNFEIRSKTKNIAKKIGSFSPLFLCVDRDPYSEYGSGSTMQYPRIVLSGGEEAADGQGPLHLAAQWGQSEVLTTLIEHGADINRQDAEGKTPLHHAIENGQQGIINMLLGCPGIHLSARDRAGLSPFACAMTFKNNSAARWEEFNK